MKTHIKTHVKILTCAIDGNRITPAKDCDIATSPVQCMEKAFTEDYELIVIQFITQAIKHREALIELCAALKRHLRTKPPPIVALLPSVHRQLLEKLNDISVEYAKIISDPINEADIRKLTAMDSISDLLEQLCPYLEYQSIDSSREIAVCGAYFSRLLLSGNRLHQTCYQADYKNCPYFNAPQFQGNKK